MKVYLLWRSLYASLGERSLLDGVFSSYEKADAFADKQMLVYDRDRFTIHEVDADEGIEVEMP